LITDQIITDLKAAKKIKCPVIYGIIGLDSRKIVYVGKTKNFGQRFESYRYSPHNAPLAKWMGENEWGLEVLEADPDDLSRAEKLWIGKFNLNDIFNMVGGGDQVWRNHSRTPWMARTGILCPSDLLLRRLSNHKYLRYEKVKKWIIPFREKLPETQRVLYEISLAKEHYYMNPGLRRLIERWLSYTEDRMIKCLQSV